MVGHLTATCRPRVSEIAEAVKGQIAGEWAAHPVMNRVAISYINVELIEPDRFASFAACVLDDEAFTLPLEVDAADRRHVRWMYLDDARLSAAVPAIAK